MYVFVRKGSGGDGGSSLPAEAWRSKAKVMKKVDLVSIFKFETREKLEVVNMRRERIWKLLI